MPANIKGLLEGRLQASQHFPRGYPRKIRRECSGNIKGLLEGPGACPPTLKDYWRAACKQVSIFLRGTLGKFAENARATLKDYWRGPGHARQH
jgi:hypothetical protein